MSSCTIRRLQKSPSERIEQTDVSCMRRRGRQYPVLCVCVRVRDCAWCILLVAEGGSRRHCSKIGAQRRSWMDGLLPRALDALGRGAYDQSGLAMYCARGSLMCMKDHQSTAWAVGNERVQLRVPPSCDSTGRSCALLSWKLETWSKKMFLLAARLSRGRA